MVIQILVKNDTEEVTAGKKKCTDTGIFKAAYASISSYSEF